MKPIVFKSKIGCELVLPLSLLLGGFMIFFLCMKLWPPFIVLAILSVFVISLFMNTYYLVDGQKLIVKSGALHSETIDIHTITKLVENRDPFSAPAASLDRLYVKHGKRGTVNISPKEKELFVQTLQGLNSNIEFVKRRS
jgi:hypothetical protein